MTSSAARSPPSGNAQLLVWLTAVQGLSLVPGVEAEAAADLVDRGDDAAGR